MDFSASDKVKISRGKETFYVPLEVAIRIFIIQNNAIAMEPAGYTALYEFNAYDADDATAVLLDWSTSDRWRRQFAIRRPLVGESDIHGYTPWKVDIAPELQDQAFALLEKFKNEKQI